MYRIAKQFSFDAAHWIAGLPEDHKCSRLHGHTYAVEVILEANHVDDVGFVIDYTELNRLKTWLDTVVDHRNLNEVFENDQTTAENIARWIYGIASEWWPQVAAIRVSETPKTWAEYRPEPGAIT